MLLLGKVMVLLATVGLAKTRLPVFASPRVRDCLAVAPIVGVVKSDKAPETVAAPLEVMARYLEVAPLLVTLKISTVPPEAWATTKPVAAAVVGVIVWVEAGSLSIQSTQEEPGTEPQLGIPPETIKTWLVEPTASLPKALAAVE